MTSPGSSLEQVTEFPYPEALAPYQPLAMKLSVLSLVNVIKEINKWINWKDGRKNLRSEEEVRSTVLLVLRAPSSILSKEKCSSITSDQKLQKKIIESYSSARRHIKFQFELLWMKFWYLKYLGWVTTQGRLKDFSSSIFIYSNFFLIVIRVKFLLE